jgi:hypothetical protein
MVAAGGADREWAECTVAARKMCSVGTASAWTLELSYERDLAGAQPGDEDPLWLALGGAVAACSW